MSDEKSKRVTGDDDQLSVAPARKGFGEAELTYAEESKNAYE